MITVLLFAHLQEQFGAEKITVNEPELTVRELKERLKTEYNWSDDQRVMTAINEEYAMDEDIIKTGDTVALIPPVSGG
ncbi:MAG TPA: molybdopterin converting factor subunit 1 [Bacillus sp. (in: firmicutes)]|nr:molybdopterin converting factor subunit 1 [Bacillus sp. (in: firmicutes)]